MVTEFRVRGDTAASSDRVLTIVIELTPSQAKVCGHYLREI